MMIYFKKVYSSNNNIAEIVMNGKSPSKVTKKYLGTVCVWL